MTRHLVEVLMSVDIAVHVVARLSKSIAEIPELPATRAVDESTNKS